MQQLNLAAAGFLRHREVHPRTAHVAIPLRDLVPEIELVAEDGRHELAGADDYHRGVGEMLTTPAFASVAYTHGYDGGIVAETLKLIEDVTVIVAGVGAWSDPPASRLIECFDAAEVQELKRQGVCADMCGFLFSPDGQVLHPQTKERIGIGLTRFEEARTVVVVAGGSEKRDALAAVLRSGTADVLPQPVPTA